VRRFNYLLGWSERGAILGLPALAPALRAPLVALACALALVGVLWAVQQARLASVERSGAEYARRLTVLTVEIARVRALERDRARLNVLRTRVETIRRSGPLHAGEIAALGDRLPDGAWLTSLRVDRGSLTLEGRGARIEAVAGAVSGLARLPAYEIVRLLSVRAESAGSAVSYALALDARR